MEFNFKNLPLNTNYIDRSSLSVDLNKPGITTPSSESIFGDIRNNTPIKQQFEITPEQDAGRVSSGIVPSNFQGGKYASLYPNLKSVAMPMRLGGGEFVQSTTNPNIVIRSERGETDSFSNYVTKGGLPSQSYEIEHVIPLWAGGEDVDSNKMLMSVDEHLVKTKVQAVPLTLFKQGKIGLPEARVMAINWKDYDPTGITLDEKGKVPDDVLNNVLKNWKTAPKISGWDWFKASILDPQGKKYTDYKSNLIRKSSQEDMEKPKSLLGEFAQSVASGFTFGRLPQSTAKYENEDEQKKMELARNIGSLVGGIGGFEALAMVGGAPLAAIGWAGKAAEAAKAAKSTSLIASLFEKSGLKALANWATKKDVNPILGSISGKLTSSGRATTGIINMVLKDDLLVNRVLKAIPLFTAAGQLTPMEYGDFRERSTQFLKDMGVAVGAGLAGSLVKTPGLKARAWENSSMFFPSFVITFVETGNLNESLVSGATMVGLHGLGKLGAKMKEGDTTYKDFMRVESNKVAKEVSNNFFKGIDVSLPKGPITDRIETRINKDVDTRLNAMVDRGILTKQEAAIKKSQALAALRQLKYGDAFMMSDYWDYRKGWGGPKKNLTEEAWNDTRSLFQLGDKRTGLENAKFSLPNKITDFIDVAFLENKKIDPSMDNATLIRDISNTVTRLRTGTPLEGSDKVSFSTPIKEVGKGGVAGTSINTEGRKNVEILANTPKEEMMGIIVEGETGSNVGELWVVDLNQKKTLFVGYIPRTPTIEKKNIKLPNNQLSTNLNNVDVVGRMRKEKIKVVPVAIDFITAASKSSGNPAIGYYINEAMWKNAKVLSDRTIPIEESRRKEQINLFKKIGGGRSKYRNDINKIDDSKIIVEDKPKRNNVTSWSDIIRNELDSGSPKSLMNKVNSLTGTELLTLKEAREIFKNKDSFTMQDAYRIFNIKNKNRKISNNEYGQSLMNDFKKLFEVDKSFADWYMDRKDIPLLGEKVTGDVTDTIIPSVSPKTKKNIIKEETITEEQPIPPEVTEETKPITEQMERDKNFEEAQEAYQIKLENEGEMPEITKPIIEEKPLPSTEIERPQDPNTGTKYSLAAQNGVDIKWIMKTNPETNKVVHSGDVIINGERMTTADASKLITSKGELLEEPKTKKGKGVSTPKDKEELNFRKEQILSSFSREMNQKIDNITDDDLGQYSRKVNRILEESLSAIREETKKAKIPFEASKIHGDIVNSLVSKISGEINNRFSIKGEMSSLGSSVGQAVNSRLSALYKAIGRFKTADMKLNEYNPIESRIKKVEIVQLPKFSKEGKKIHFKERTTEIDVPPGFSKLPKEPEDESNFSSKKYKDEIWGYETKFPRSAKGERVTPYYDKFKEDVSIDKIDFKDPSNILKYVQDKSFKELENQKWNKLNTWLADEMLQPGTEANEIFLSSTEPLKNEISYAYRGLGLEKPKIKGETKSSKDKVILEEGEKDRIIQEERDKIKESTRGKSNKQAYGKTTAGLNPKDIIIEFPEENKTNVDRVFFNYSINPWIMKENPQAMFKDAKRFMFNFVTTYNRLLENKQRIGQMKGWKKISVPSESLKKLEKEVKDKSSSEYQMGKEIDFYDKDGELKKGKIDNYLLDKNDNVIGLVSGKEDITFDRLEKNKENLNKMKFSFPINYENIGKMKFLEPDYSIENIPKNLITPELAKKEVSKNGFAIQYIPRKLLTPELVKIAVSKNGLSIRYVPEELITPELRKIAASYVPVDIKKYKNLGMIKETSE